MIAPRIFRQTLSAESVNSDHRTRARGEAGPSGVDHPVAAYEGSQPLRFEHGLALDANPPEPGLDTDSVHARHRADLVAISPSTFRR